MAAAKGRLHDRRRLRDQQTQREDARQPRASLPRNREGHHRPARHDRPAADRPAYRRPYPARRRARPGQDIGGPNAGPGLAASVSSHSVHARPAAGRRHRHADLQPAHRRVQHQEGADLRQSACWPTRSIAPLPRCKAPCSRRCRKSRSPSATPLISSIGLSWCWPRRTPSSRKGLTRCPRPRSIASCSRSSSTIRTRKRSWRSSTACPRWSRR